MLKNLQYVENVEMQNGRKSARRYKCEHRRENKHVRKGLVEKNTKW